MLYSGKRVLVPSLCLMWPRLQASGTGAAPEPIHHKHPGHLKALGLLMKYEWHRLAGTSLSWMLWDVLF